MSSYLMNEIKNLLASFPNQLILSRLRVLLKCVFYALAKFITTNLNCSGYLKLLWPFTIGRKLGSLQTLSLRQTDGEQIKSRIIFPTTLPSARKVGKNVSRDFSFFFPISGPNQHRISKLS